MNVQEDQTSGTGTRMNQTGAGASQSLAGVTGMGSVTTRLTRSPRNQLTIDAITHDPKKRVQQELVQLGKDIYDNVLEYRKSPGPMNQTTIDFALQSRMWDPTGQES